MDFCPSSLKSWELASNGESSSFEVKYKVKKIQILTLEGFSKFESFLENTVGKADESCPRLYDAYPLLA